jgi:hypothetical protein
MLTTLFLLSLVVEIVKATPAPALMTTDILFAREIPDHTNLLGYIPNTTINAIGLGR